MAAQTRKNVVKNIAKTISDVSEHQWNRKDEAKVAITVDGLFTTKRGKEQVLGDDRIALDIRAMLSDRFHLQCENIAVTIAWIPGKSELKEREF